MSVFRKIVKHWLLRRGAIISRPPGQFDVTEYKLMLAKRRGLDVNRVLDGGAHVGDWTRMVKAIYPDAAVVMVEPREDVQPALHTVIEEQSGVSVLQALLGEQKGNVGFHVSGAQSSILPDNEGRAFGRVVSVPMTTINEVIEAAGWPSADLIKLDLQGYELKALAGADRVLARTSAVILEVSFVAFQESTPLARDVVEFMAEHGFELYDILALSHRPLDGRLAQGDMLFLRAGHPLLADTRWTSQGSGFWAAT